MLIVIADDITGAAEIAGIGLHFGLNVRMITQFENVPDCDLLVCATDTRSLSENEAVNITQTIIRKLIASGCTQIFKKTDSALRGHIISELKVLMKESDFDKTLFLPQNPSRGRIINDGIYLIDKIPLHQTSFAYDPEFPALTSDVEEYLKDVILVKPETHINVKKGICIADAGNCEDIKRYFTHLNTGTLLAGGADFFTEYLYSLGKTLSSTFVDFEGLENKDSIVICGSTINHTLSDFDYFKRKAVHFCNMPAEVFEGSNPAPWIKQIKQVYLNDKSVVLAINRPAKGGKEYAVRLRNIMAEAVYTLVKSHTPQELLIEGGATAFAVLNKLKWTDFRLTNEIAPGVVRMSPAENPSIHITLKPGSYNWGDKVFK